MSEKGEVAAYQVPVDIPSHCELMKPAAEKLALEIQKETFMAPKIPIVMNVNGKITIDPLSIKNNLSEQLIRPVLFQQSIEVMISAGVDTFIEIGPNDVLSRFVIKITKESGVKVDTFNIEDIDTLNALVDEIKG